MRRTPLLGAALGVCALAQPLLGAGPDPTTLALERVATIERPTFVTHAPGDPERLFVAQRSGVIWVVRGELASPYIDLTERVTLGAEGGLLGVAFHPGFAENGTLFVCYTSTDGWLIESLRVDDPGADRPALVERSRVLTQVDGAGSIHQGGWIGFGPDGYLRASLGETGRSTLSQDLTDRRGSLMRLDVWADDFPDDPDQNYAIPADNPFLDNPDAAPEISAFGLRNPYRCSFDIATGDLWIANVGGSLPGEFQRIDSASVGGQNYGWPCFEGGECRNIVTCPEGGCDEPGIVAPVFAVPREQGRCALTGVEIYRGYDVPSLRGTLLFTDYCARRLESLVIETGELGVGPAASSAIYALGHDLDGELYVCDLSGVWRVVPADAGCPADWNGDGFLNDQDFFDFTNDFFDEAGPRGHQEFNRDGYQNGQDFFDFINAFFTPAPPCVTG